MRRSEPAASMLYLIRHAHALDGDDDAARPLSDRGREQVKRLAEFLRGNGAFAAAEIWHSPLMRAGETAALLARRISFQGVVREVEGLLPEDDPAAIARQVKTLREPIALVGHEPYLSALASLLIAGSADRTVFVMKKCAALALERTIVGWAACWQISPELLK